MTIEEFNSSALSILSNLDNQGEVSTTLNTLQQEYSNISATNKELNDKITQLEKDRENLRDANMKLFLQVGNKSTENNNNDKSTNENDKLSFDDLFDEKGEIK